MDMSEQFLDKQFNCYTYCKQHYEICISDFKTIKY